MNKEFEKQALISINIIREWNDIDFLDKLSRARPKPSQIDYHLANKWITKQDVIVSDSEVYNSKLKRKEDKK